MPNQITHTPSRYGDKAAHYLIFFITGNPGLISYYDTFLASLNYLLSSESPLDGYLSPTFLIFGQSLAGFEDEDVPLKSKGGAPYRLTEEIDFTLDALKGQKIPGGDRKGEDFDGIVLIGHSVGSYILLEILRKLRDAEHLGSRIRIRGGILLFPTITHISKSPNGKKLGSLLRIPDFPRSVSIQTQWFLWLFPRIVLKWLVGLVTGMSQDAVETTAKFLTSRNGVLQALYVKLS
jgi:pimeloyl-ACP methyl ester carboxylesterase